MNKEAFLHKLSSLIRDLPDNERATILDFYREIIEDKIESGVSECEAIAGLGDIYQLAQKILLENPNRRPRHTNRTGAIVFCSIMGLFLLLAIISGIMNTAMHYTGGNSSSLQGKIVVNGKEVTNVNNENKSFTAKADGVTKIQLQAENKSIHITPTDGAEIKIDYVSNRNQTYKFSSENGVVSMENRDSKSNFSLFDFNFSGRNDETITIEVPAQYANDISIQTTNSGIDISSFKNLHDVTCTTTNSAIKLSDIHVNSVKIDTKNAAITMNNVNAQEKLEALTKNAQISLRRISAQDITLKTDNGIIGGTISGRKEDYTIDSSTSNGVNNLQNSNGGNKNLTVTTSNAIINVSFADS